VPQESNKAVVQRHFDDVLNAGNLAVVDEIYTDDVLFHGPQGIVQGKGPIQAWVGMMHRAFSEFTTDVEMMVAEDDRVVAKVIARACHRRPFMDAPATDCHVVIPMTIIFHLRDGRIAELENIYDSQAFADQLGSSLPLMHKL